MPLVQVTMWSGISEDSKKKIAEGITKVFEDMGVPRDAVELLIYETPKTNWATGGKLHSALHAKRQAV
jgi:4-oxalocrotonate tautomerase